MVEKIHDLNPLASRLRHHKQENDFSCGSSALTICYDAFGFIYPEGRIRQDYGMTNFSIFSWSQMLEHPRTLGFKTNFYFGQEYEVLLPKYDSENTLVIVGWMARYNTNFYCHYSPARFLDLDKIILSNGGTNFDTLTRNRFESRWHDKDHTHPFMTISS